jgi:hypothetical protein
MPPCSQRTLCQQYPYADLLLALPLPPSSRCRDGQGGGSQADEREWFRSASSHLEDNSSQALPRLSGESEYPGLTSRHLGEFSVDGGDGASTFGGSSVTGGASHAMRGSHSSRHLEAHSGKMSLLQVRCAVAHSRWTACEG